MIPLTNQLDMLPDMHLCTCMPIHNITLYYDILIVQDGEGNDIFILLYYCYLLRINTFQTKAHLF